MSSTRIRLVRDLGLVSLYFACILAAGVVSAGPRQPEPLPQPVEQAVGVTPDAEAVPVAAPEPGQP